MGYIYPGVIIPKKPLKAHSFYRSLNEKYIRSAIRKGRLIPDRTLCNYIQSKTKNAEKIFTSDGNVNQIHDNDTGESEEEEVEFGDNVQYGDVVELPRITNIQELPLEIIFHIIIDSGELHSLLKVNKLFYNTIKLNEISLKFRIISERYIHVVEYKKNKSKVKSSIYQYSQVSTADIEFHHENALLTPMDLSRASQGTGDSQIPSSPSSPSQQQQHDTTSKNIFSLPKARKPNWEITVLDADALMNSSMSSELLMHLSPECIQSTHDIQRFKAFVEKEDESPTRISKSELVSKFGLGKIQFPFVDRFEEGDKIVNWLQKKKILDFLFSNKHRSVQSVDRVMIYYLHILMEDKSRDWLLVSHYQTLLKYIKSNLNLEDETFVKLRDARLIILLLKHGILAHFSSLMPFYDKEALSHDDFLWNYVKESKKWRLFELLRDQGIEPNTRFLGSRSTK